MPISKDQFQTIEDEGDSLPDLGPDTTQGTVYRYLFEHADQAFRQREIVDGVDVPEGSVGPTLKRLEEHGLVEHRDQYWAVSDVEHAVVSAGFHGAATADGIDGGFSDDDVDAWMENAVDPIEGTNESEEQ